MECVDFTNLSDAADFLSRRMLAGLKGCVMEVRTDLFQVWAWK